MRTGRLAWTLSLVMGCLVIVQATAALADEKQAVLTCAQQAAATGRFSEAEALLREQLADPGGPVVDELAVQLEILRRIRLDYSLTGDQVLTQLRASIPDVTADDMEAWREQGVLQHRMIDGKCAISIVR